MMTVFIFENSDNNYFLLSILNALAQSILTQRADEQHDDFLSFVTHILYLALQIYCYHEFILRVTPPLRTAYCFILSLPTAYYDLILVLRTAYRLTTKYFLSFPFL